MPTTARSAHPMGWAWTGSVAFLMTVATPMFAGQGPANIAASNRIQGVNAHRDGAAGGTGADPSPVPAANRVAPGLVQAVVGDDSGPSNTGSPITGLKNLANKLVGKGPAGDAEDDGNDPRAVAHHFDRMTNGSSSPTVRKRAIALLPLDRLTEQQRADVNAVLNNVSFYRRLPTLVFAAEPDVYTYFMNNPHVTVGLWRAMKISKMQLEPDGEGVYLADTGDGTTGRITVLHRSADKLLVLCDGVYKNPLLARPVKARSVLHLQTSFSKESNGAVYATHRGDLFVTFPSQTMDAVARIVSPLTVSLTDRTFCEISLFVKMMSSAMANRPGWVESFALQLEGVDTKAADDVINLTARVYVAEQRRRNAKAAGLGAELIEKDAAVVEPNAVDRNAVRPASGQPTARTASAEVPAAASRRK
jgi:hypothetical protein